MNLYDFDPDKICLLDGYFLVKRAFPKINLYDFEACENALNLILSEVKFDVWDNVNTSHARFWVKVSFKQRMRSHPFGKLEANYALAVLTPAGKVFDSVMKTNVVGTFEFESEKYVEFADGLVVRLRPSLDRRFLKLYPQETLIDGLDYFESLDVVV